MTESSPKTPNHRSSENTNWDKYKNKTGGAWMAQSVKHPTLDFGSGHSLRGCEIEPLASSTLSGESA